MEGKGTKKIIRQTGKRKNDRSKSSIIVVTSNVNYLNSPMKRLGLEELILNNHSPTICYIQETHLY